jgi:hypothetical protein
MGKVQGVWRRYSFDRGMTWGRAVRVRSQAEAIRKGHIPHRLTKDDNAADPWYFIKPSGTLIVTFYQR